MSRISRSKETMLSTWFYTVDRWLVGLVLMLVTLGVLLTLAASQGVARRLDLDPFHFFERQLLWVVLGLGVMFAISLLNVTQVRRMAVLLFPVCLLGMVATLFVGSEIKGATRWLPLGPFALQPSEFLKPCFVVVTAWILTARFRDPETPALQLSFGVLTLVVGLLVLQPDFGQTALISTVWIAMAFLAGLSTLWVAAAGVTGFGLITLAFFTVPHVRERIERFLDPESGDTYQIDKALEAVRNGGLFGQGPGEGSVKHVLPDAHTDFIFAVAAEEFGLLACTILILLYLAIVVRVFKQQLEVRDPFVFLASAGLTIQFGAQAFINMGVNLALLPSKGMTLPFISYGGSSFLALALTMGMVLALSRKNRFLDRSEHLFRSQPNFAAAAGSGPVAQP
jgi:cell division protein FtsW